MSWILWFIFGAIVGGAATALASRWLWTKRDKTINEIVSE